MMPFVSAMMNSSSLSTPNLYPSELVLLLKMEGANGGTAFIDESPAPKTITRNGTPTTSTSRFKEGASSALFASGDYLSTPDHADFDFGIGAFTVSAWVYKTNSGLGFIIGQRDGDPHWGLGHDVNGNPEYIWYLNGGGGVSGSGGRQILNEWVHYAISRNTSGVYRLRQNGKVVSTSTDTRALASISYDLKIGRSGTPIGSGFPLTGNIDLAMIVKGVDLYDTADSVLMPSAIPTTPVFFIAPKIDASGGRAVGNTLTCSSGLAWPNAGSYTYQWKLAGTPISGATSSSYTIQSGDDVTTLSCTVSNGAGSHDVKLGHRYWRVNVTTTNGSSYAAVTEIEMMRRTDQGSECQSTYTTIYSTQYSTGNEAAANAFDGVFDTKCWASNGGAMPQYVGQDFTAAVSPDITRVRIRSRSSADASQAPQAFSVQWSDDNSSWTTAWSVSGQTGWGNYEERVFDKP